MRDSSLVVTGRVVGAVALRDLQTRFGGHSLNYIIAVLWPLAHLAVILAAYSILGRMAPIGTSAPLFFVTGLLPFITFNYPSRMMMMSVMLNRPLLGLPVVKLTDIIMGRAILETVTAFMVIAIVGLIMYGCDVDIMPRDPGMAAAALVATLCMGLSLGILNTVIVSIVPFWVFAYALSIILMYALSGIVFVPDQLPQRAQDFLHWNPLLQCVTWFRSAYYPGYGQHILDLRYLFVFTVVVLLLGLLGERMLRKYSYKG